jgi:hypothetical protein
MTAVLRMHYSSRVLKGPRPCPGFIVICILGLGCPTEDWMAEGINLPTHVAGNSVVWFGGISVAV